eukprot:SAG25_NODE_5181_length_692_cov_1.067454_1_plen_82_part_01
MSPPSAARSHAGALAVLAGLAGATGAHPVAARATSPPGRSAPPPPQTPTCTLTTNWTVTTGDEVYSSPAIAADGTVYVGSDE